MLVVEPRRLAYTYGPLWLVAPLALRTSSFAPRGLVLVGLCVASMTFAFDWGRIIFLAAPVFFVATALTLRGRRRLALATVIALFALELGYAICMQAYGVQHGIDTSVIRHVPVYRPGPAPPIRSTRLNAIVAARTVHTDEGGAHRPPVLRPRMVLRAKARRNPLWGVA
jgi:hypothetical protein